MERAFLEKRKWLTYFLYYDRAVRRDTDAVLYILTCLQSFLNSTSAALMLSVYSLPWSCILEVYACRASQPARPVKPTADVGGTGFVFQGYKWSRAVTL